MANQGKAGSFRDKVHGLLRASILDAAWVRASGSSWSQVRLADIADDVGVSRQTIYNEFGTKDQLSIALFERELEQFLTELEDRIRSAAKFDVAIRGTLSWMLDEAAGHRLLTRMVEDSREGSPEGLVALLTVGSRSIIVPVRARLTAVILERWPEADETATTVVADLFVRFVLNQVIAPSDLEREQFIDAMVSMAMNIQVPSGTAR